MRTQLNEILKVRHSFAHGFSIPAYSWTQTSKGKIRLTAQAVDDVGAFFKHLVRVSDQDMKNHIEMTYSVTVFW